MLNDLLQIPTSSPTVFRGLVLVVDDEEQNRILLRDPLEARGYEVIEAENGAAAMEAIGQRTPDVILLDVMMPKMDGFEVCRRVKRNQDTAAIPVLMVTALSERKERLMGVEAGANDFLSKPVDVQDLSLRVANAVYAKHLFDQLKAEQRKSDQLLLNILPKSIAERMKNGETSIADDHPEVTVLMADLVGFTRLASHINPEQIVCLLNEIFSSFDVSAGKHDLEKIKTVGDAYMVASGIPKSRPNNPDAVAAFALDILRDMERFNSNYDTSINIRVGIATGPAIAGVIGSTKFAYDLWGHTVNTACYLETVAKPGCLQVCEKTFELLQERFPFSERQNVIFKGNGEIGTYELVSK